MRSNTECNGESPVVILAWLNGVWTDNRSFVVTDNSRRDYSCYEASFVGCICDIPKYEPVSLAV